VLARHAIAAAVAATVLFAASLPAQPPGKSKEITFVVWNVRNYRLQPVKDNDGKVTTPAKDPASVTAVARTLAALRPDIVGLCEIGSEEDLADLQSRLAALGTELPHRTFVDGADRERRLALLSRFPLRDVHHDIASAFKLGGLPHRIQRGFLDCTAEIGPEFALRLVGAHFNGEQWTYHWPESDECRRVDYIMVSKALAPLVRKRESMIDRSKEWTLASDHRPLVVKIGSPARKKE